MRKILFFGILVLVLVATSLFSSCQTTSTSTSSAAPSSTVQPSTTKPTAVQPSTTQAPASTQVTTAPATTATKANWWDKFGTPQYGGSITIATAQFPNGFDPYNWQYTSGGWRDSLWFPDWTMDRSSGIFGHRLWMSELWKGLMAESWAWTDSKTLTVHLHHDIKWQKIEPVNGRAFTAQDVVYHFDRMMGTGNGFTSYSPFMFGRFDACERVTATDDYTVVFHYKNPTLFINSVATICETMFQSFEAKEVYAMGKPVSEGSGLNTALNDWKTQIGTGPFMMSDFVANSTMTLVKNPDYWAYDERYPKNKLPYVDTYKTLFIPDTTTALSALRTGKVDYVPGINRQQSATLKASDPNLMQEPYIQPGSLIQLRVDTSPFTDIRVRQALQLAINLPEIAKGYYGGTVDGKPVGLVSPYFTGYTIPYDNWSQELKDEYGYNPIKARQLLTDAGYPNGFKTNIITGSSGPGADVNLLQVIKAYFADVSVDMEIKTEADFFTVMNILMNKKHTQMVAMGTSDDMPPQMGMRMYTKAEPTNGLCNDDPVWEGLVAKVLTANTPDEAKKFIVDADQYFLKQHWVVTVFPIWNYNVWQPYLKGFSGEKEPLNGVYARLWISK